MNQVNENQVDRDAFKMWVNDVAAYGDALLELVVLEMNRTLDEAIAAGTVDIDALVGHVENFANWVQDQLVDDITTRLGGYQPYLDVVDRAQKVTASAAGATE